uniref:MarR family transcriptional regulator n=1 Tax=Patulibacter defluvii TaxID=3095358 RepID=UPI0035C936E8
MGHEVPQHTGHPAVQGLPMIENAATSEVVDNVRQTIEGRLAELQPYLAEAEQLRSILTAIDNPEPAASGTGQRTRQGANKQAILAVIAKHPGITAAEIARMTGMKRTVVASTVSRLKRIGELEPQERGVRLPDGAASPVAA